MKYALPDDSEIHGKNDLIRPASETLHAARRMLRRCKDSDVMFVPVDPLAHDAAATEEGEANSAWTLGHIIAHMTASTEEGAALAAELARGVPYHGRSRAEAPWRSIATVAQCRARLEESGRMRLASLGMWPDTPGHLPSDQPAPVQNATKRYMDGIRHEAGHLTQIEDVITQARVHRRRQTWWWRLFHPNARKGAASQSLNEETAA